MWGSSPSGDDGLRLYAKLVKPTRPPSAFFNIIEIYFPPQLGCIDVEKHLQSRSGSRPPLSRTEPWLDPTVCEYIHGCIVFKLYAQTEKQTNRSDHIFLTISCIWSFYILLFGYVFSSIEFLMNLGLFTKDSLQEFSSYPVCIKLYCHHHWCS